MKNPSLALAIFALGSALSGAAEMPPPRGIAPPARIPDMQVLTAAPPGTPVNIATVPQSIRRAVVEDAAKKFGVAEAQIVLIRAEQLTWPDGSLGCAAAGQVYTQALIPGYRLVAKYVTGELSYHTDSRAHVVSCSGATLSPDARKSGAKSLSEAIPGPTRLPVTPDR